MQLGEAFIALGFNVDDTSLKAFSDKIDELETNLFKVSGTAAAALYGLDKFIDTVSHAAIALRDLNIQTGLSQDGLQQWSLAAHLSDTAFSTEAAISSISSLQSKLGELKRTGQGAGAFSLLTGTDARNMDAFQVLQLIHERMAYLNSSPMIGGRAGLSSVLQQAGIDPHFLNLLEQTDDQFKKTQEHAQQFMMTVGENNNLVAMDYATEQLRMKLELLSKQLGATFAPTLISAMQALPPLLQNIATGLKLLEVPLGILVAGTLLLISPWIPFLAILYDVIAAVEIIGAKMNAKGDNWVKEMYRDAVKLGDYLDKHLVEPMKWLLNHTWGAHFNTTFNPADARKEIGKAITTPSTTADDIAKINNEDANTVHNFMRWLKGLDVNSDVSKENRAMSPINTLLSQQQNKPLGATTNNNTIAPTMHIHTSDAQTGVASATKYSNDMIDKAFDITNNGGF